MAAQTLSYAQAFGTGSDLWVMTDEINTKLNRKIDWYLNFQITRAQQHKSQSLSPQLRTVLTENELQLADYQLKPDSPILILAGAQLPTTFLMVVPVSAVKKWSQTVRERWLAMNKPKLRVFLPSSMTAGEFQQGWGANELAGLSIVAATQ